MSFVGKAIAGIGKAVGLIPKAPEAPNVPAMLPAPTMSSADVSAKTDAAAQQAAASQMRGFTSTMLTGSQGEDETKLNTSKVLLGQ